MNGVLIVTCAHVSFGKDIVSISKEMSGANVSKIPTFKTFLSIRICWQNWPSYVHVKGMKMEMSQYTVTYFLSAQQGRWLFYQVPQKEL